VGRAGRTRVRTGSQGQRTAMGRRPAESCGVTAERAAGWTGARGGGAVPGRGGAGGGKLVDVRRGGREPALGTLGRRLVGSWDIFGIKL
jgi:hypothetical protein